MDHTLTHGIGLVFYFFLFWLALQLAYAAWGSERATAGWKALVETAFMRRIGIKWVSAVLLVVIGLQIVLVVSMLGISAYTGNPIRFD